MTWWLWTLVVVGGVLVVVALADLIQTKHAILRNFPIVGHFRYWLESIGPELRQYIVTNNNEERPFSRDQRRWVYASSKKENNYFGFGTDAEIELSPNFLIIKQSQFPLDNPHPGAPDYDPKYNIPCAKILGGPRHRTHAFRPNSVVNISAMSFGSLSGAAIESLNRGAAIAGCLHNTGEGGVSPHHKHGGDLIWQIGTGYYGCRDKDGKFDMDRLVDTVRSSQVRALEIKLSQGAKPGLGGVLPSAKITKEIADIRLIPMGQDCISPAKHATFSDVDSLLDWVEELADKTGLPVGVKSAVGDLGFWHQLADAMESGNRGVDYIAIDGGEGGTGAAPLAFSDHVAMPFKIAMTRVYRIFAERGLDEHVVFVGSGRLGFPEASLFGFAVGCDMIHVAREPMLAIGCIQAQRCHTGHCPTGVATQNKWLIRGLDPTHKAARLANYMMTLRKEILRLTRACGHCHPAMITGDHLEVLDGRFGSTSIYELFNYSPSWGVPGRDDIEEISRIMGECPVSEEPVLQSERT